MSLQTSVNAKLLKLVASNKAVRLSFRRDPLMALAEIEKRFDLKLGKVTPEDLDAIASMSDDELALLMRLAR